MEKEKQEFIPEISVNNTKVSKEIEIDGKMQEVEVPAQEGFNIKTRDLEGKYSKDFFVKDLEAVILFDRYQIQSKYVHKPAYMSNEFEFTGSRNDVRVYCPDEKRVLYEGPYAGTKTEFATGQVSPKGIPEKTFDVFSILYVLISGDIFKFRWKLNQNNNWFTYKDGCQEERDDNGFRNFTTKFALEKKKFGINEFWACNLQNIGKTKEDKVDEIANGLEDKLDAIADTYKSSGEVVKKEIEKSGITGTEVSEDDIDVENLPF